MIETHVVNTFMASGLRESAWFPLLNYVNGLVAPSFLFVAGFVYGWERRISPNKPVNYRRRASRLLTIGALGYALHFPSIELAGHRWADALRAGTQFDVLPCLALSLGLLLGVTWLAERMERLSRAAWWIGVVLLAATAVLGAPFVTSWTAGPVPLRALVNQTTGSLFPLLPWTGFVLLGALAGAWLQRPIHERATGMIGLAVLAWSCRSVIFSPVSPSFFLERAAWVLALAAVCEWSARRSLPPLILFAGKHSLTLYVTHLVLIGALAGIGVPAGLSPAATLAVLAVVAGGSFAVASFSGRLAAWPAREWFARSRAETAATLSPKPQLEL